MHLPAFRVRLRTGLASLALAAGALAPAAARAVTYALITPPSALEVGCQGPCACAVITTPTYGSFDLVFTGSDPLYSYYDVDRYIASFNNGPGAVAIVGAGKFRIGGEFALVEQLTLDVQVEGNPLQHFDSGLIPAPTPFPQLDLSCAVHGFSCLDSVLLVDAKPLDSADTRPPARPAGIQAVWPNPFPNRTFISFVLERREDVMVTVVDLQGRRIRTLGSAASIGPGLQTVAWDGRGDDGQRVSAGVYWVRIRWPEGADQRPVIKLP
jgi:hypothetical protein